MFLLPLEKLARYNNSPGEKKRGGAMLKCQKIKPSQQQQFSVIFQASEMRGKIHSIARSEEGHSSFSLPWLQHRPQNFTELFLSLSAVSCSENTFWKNILL